MKSMLPHRVLTAFLAGINLHSLPFLKLRYAVSISFLLFFQVITAQTWTPVSAPSSGYNDIWGVDASNIWVAGNGGLIRKYDGVSWNINYGAGNDILGIHGTSSSNILAVSPYSAALKYNGTSWSQQTILSDVGSVWTSGTSNAWALAYSGEIWHYNGTSWTSDFLPTYQLIDHYDIWGASPSNVRVVGTYGYILRYNGFSWDLEFDATNIGILITLRSIWGANASNVWAVGTDGTILKFNGFSWDQQSSGTTETLNGVWGTDASNVWAVGENGTILKYDGVSWTTQNSGVSNSLTGIWGTGNKFWVCGAFGTLLYSTNQFPPLPIEITHFQAQLQPDRTARLQWQTASERDNAGFGIERSDEGKTWTKIGFVAGNGTTTEKQTYQYADDKPLPGNNYYRLAQQDFDGKVSFSDVRNVVLAGAGNDGFSVFPNPVIQGELTIQLSEEPDTDASIRIYSADGRQVLQQPVTSAVHTFHTSEWNPGIYFIEVKNGAKAWREQVVVK
ncbi:MAG TPA: T9SS type A sorting domain-containing protein [Saprospiraceae bacterium]|nr:T9SS type A sorting domain-containing protein [Saprospiraceae bacterium]HPI05786.1 T9SS type A sorting domain-containing protein [Saprospiraceae bacterium]